MAKQIELQPLKKGLATFNLVGKAKVSDFTFKLDVESGKEGSDWVYNKMDLGVNCGKNGTIYGTLMSGYGTDRQNKVYVHGKKEVDGQTRDDMSKQFTIAWEDRFDEKILENIGEMCFITVGIEKDVEEKTLYKKFLTAYDAISYISEYLKDGDVINVKGNLKWQEYNGKIQYSKEITSIALSKAEESDYKATFIQTILVDSNSIGKVDKDTMTIPIDGYVVENIKSYQGQSITRKVENKDINGVNLPLLKSFDIEINPEDKEKINKMLKQFKAKPKKVNQIVVDGYFARGNVETTTISEDDIPDDIKELIELGYVDKEEIINKIAFANGDKKPEKMYIKAPHIKIKKGEIPSIDRIDDIYSEDDINIDLILEKCNTKLVDDLKSSKPSNEDNISKEEALNIALDNDDNEEGSDDWLKDL